MPLPGLVASGIKIAAQLAAGYFIDSILSNRPQAADVTTRSTTASRKIVYGKALVSGPVVYANVGHQTYHPLRKVEETGKALLYQAIALAGHACKGFGALHLDDLVIPAEHLSWGADGGGTGGVTGGKARHNNVSYVSGWAHLGGADQTADTHLTHLFPDGWTSDHRGRGLTYAVVMMQDDEYARKRLFKKGAPTKLVVEVEGKNDIYDPRRDTKPGAHPDNADYQGWSDNPALCWADYLIDEVVGMGLPPSRIDWDAVVTAGNRCDEVVTTRAAWEEHHLDGRPSTVHPAITEKRYTCNGVLFTRDTHRDNIQTVLDTMNGAASYTGGQFVVQAYSYQAPALSISEDDLVGPVEISTNDDQFRAFNAIRGTFIDPEAGYTEIAYPQMTSQTLVNDRDNGQTLYRDLDLPMTTSATMAQRLAYQRLQQAGLNLIATLPLTYKGLKLSVGDRITVTVPRLGWRDKVMRVIRWRFDPLQGVQVTVREEDPSAYDDPSPTDIRFRRTVPPLAFNEPVVPAPTHLSATGIQAGIEVTWSLPEPRTLWDEIVLYAAATNDWASAEEIWRGVSTAYVHLLNADATRFYWARAAQGEDLSARAPDADTSTVTATAQGLLIPAFKPGASGSPIPNGIADPLHIEVAAGVVWSGGWWQDANSQWWWLWHAADVPSFTRAQAHFYLPTGDIRNVPTT